MCLLYGIQGKSDDGFQQTLAMLGTVPQYWIPMLNPIVSMLTVKKYRLRVLAIFGFGKPIVPATSMVADVGGGDRINRIGIRDLRLNHPL